MDKSPASSNEPLAQGVYHRVRALTVRGWYALRQAYAWASPQVRDKLRAVSLLVLYVTAFWAMHAVAPDFAPEKRFALAFIAARVALGGFLGYWCDRIVFPYSRPHKLTGIERGAAEKRRAILVAAHVIAAGINL